MITCEVAIIPVLHLEDGEGYVLVPAGSDWDYVDSLFVLAAQQGYVEVDEDEDEPDVLPDGTLRFWLHNPVLFLSKLEGPLWLS